LRNLPLIVVSADEMFLREHAGQFQADGFALVGVSHSNFEEFVAVRDLPDPHLSAPRMASMSSAE
jgi:hypothetical protein